MIAGTLTVGGGGDPTVGEGLLGGGVGLGCTGIFGVGLGLVDRKTAAVVPCVGAGETRVDPTGVGYVFIEAPAAFATGGEGDGAAETLFATGPCLPKFEEAPFEYPGGGLVLSGA